MTEPRTEAIMPCLVLVDGPLAAGVLVPGTDYRVIEVREHWEPSPEEGGAPTISTVIRFDPSAASPSLDRDRLREAAQRLYDRLSRAAGGEFMQDDIEALGAALSSEETT